MGLKVNYGSSSPQVLLTAADVEQWKVELAQAEKVVADLKRKLEAAAVFFPADAARMPPQELSVNDWIVKVLADAQKKLTPREIRAAILREGGPVGSENYLYTAIQRALRRGVIIKRDDGYVISAAGSPEGEAGSLSASSPLSSGLTLSGGSVAADLKAGGT
jgi:hypothetical protein